MFAKRRGNIKSLVAADKKFLVGPAQKSTFLRKCCAPVVGRSRHRRPSLAIRARVAARRRHWHPRKSSDHVALAYRQRKVTSIRLS
jgi:hypothetical protein